MTVKRKYPLSDLLFFFALLSGYLGVTFFLFHRQSVNYAGPYLSDMGAYILEIQGQDSGYRYPYPILFLTGKLLRLLFSPELAMALATAFWNVLTPIALKYYFDRFLQVGDTESSGRRFLSTLLVFSLLFVSMLYPLTWLGRYHDLGADYLYRYQGTFTPNPYHNATYLAARPFSVPAFFLFADILTFYEKEERWLHPKYALFSLALLLATLTKPSFTLVLVSVAGIIMLWRLVSGRFQGIKAFFRMGIWFLPTFLALLYQFGDVFGTGDTGEGGIGFGFLTAWSTATDRPLLSIVSGIAFPLTVILFCLLRRELPGLLRFAWQFFLAALLTLTFFYEKGYRLPHLNFSWGYMYGLFFLYTVSLIVLTGNTLGRRQPVWQLGIQWGVYGLHMVCGMDYFRILLQGGLFY